MGSSFIPIAFQELLPNSVMRSIARDNTFNTEVPLRSPFFIYTIADALSSTIDLIHNQVIGILTLAGSATLEYGFCQFDAGDVYAIDGTMTINMSHNSAFSGDVPLLAYIDMSTANMADKLIFRLNTNTNTNTAVEPRVFAPISGGYITSVNRFQMFGNSGYRADVHSSWLVNFGTNKILPPTEFVIELGANAVTEGPTMEGTGFAFIKVLSSWNSGQPIIEMYEYTGSTNNYLHFQIVGGTWKKATLN